MTKFILLAEHSQLLIDDIKQHYPNIETNNLEHIAKIIELSGEKYPETDLNALRNRVFSNLTTYKNENLLRVMFNNYNEQLNLLSKTKLKKK